MKHAGFIAGIAISALALTAAAAFAEKMQGKGHHGPRASFEQLDTDADGQLTQAELESHRAARFDEMDTNGDGKLSAEEIQVKANEKARDRSARMMERFDADGDGALSRDEMPKPRNAGRMFDRIDADGSGGISKEEFETARSKMKEHGQKGHGKHKSGGTEQN